MENNMKPLILEIEEAKSDILKAVNNSLKERHIPGYFLKDFLFDIANQVAKKASNEIEHLKAKEREETKNTENPQGE